jgi:ATP/ADP translocase
MMDMSFFQLFLQELSAFVVALVYRLACQVQYLLHRRLSKKLLRASGTMRSNVLYRITTTTTTTTTTHHHHSSLHPSDMTTGRSSLLSALSLLTFCFCSCCYFCCFVYKSRAKPDSLTLKAFLSKAATESSAAAA